MTELEILRLEERVEDLQRQLIAREIRIVQLETDLEQAELASARALMMLMGGAGVAGSPIDQLAEVH